MGKSITGLSSVTRVGLDLAKNVFQVHGVDAKGEVVIRRKLRRNALPQFFAKLAPCVVAMEACSSAHHWARMLVGLGHEIRLIPPAHVKPYVRRNKNDAADAAAICEAAGRPGQRFVPVRGIDNQAELMRHRARKATLDQGAPSRHDACIFPQHGRSFRQWRLLRNLQWRASAVLSFPICRISSPSAATGAKRCFSATDDYALYRDLLHEACRREGSRCGPIA